MGAPEQLDGEAPILHPWSAGCCAYDRDDARAHAVEQDPGPVPGEDPAPAAGTGPAPEVGDLVDVDDAGEFDVTLPAPAEQDDPHGRPPGRMCQDDPSWPGADE